RVALDGLDEKGASEIGHDSLTRYLSHGRRHVANRWMQTGTSRRYTLRCGMENFHNFEIRATAERLDDCEGERRAFIVQREMLFQVQRDDPVTLPKCDVDSARSHLQSGAISNQGIQSFLEIRHLNLRYFDTDGP